MAGELVVSDLRVQRLDRGDGSRSHTIVWPEGAVHREADRFLRTCEPGTDRTYAYLLVDHLRWLERVYSPTTLVTALADYAGRGVQTGVVSSTKPDLMLRMLEALRVADGMRVLEIGTGTGYNAALLCHRLGDGNVSSIDIDPALVADARARLAKLGYHPRLVATDGAEGIAGDAPFDRVIATCSVRAIPPAWIHQLASGGLLSKVPLAPGISSP